VKRTAPVVLIEVLDFTTNVTIDGRLVAGFDAAGSRSAGYWRARDCARRLRLALRGYTRVPAAKRAKGGRK
jgi:hypothetical protein